VSGQRELFGAGGCPYTAELREQLLWDGDDFVEYDVEADAAAFARLLALTGGRRGVPVLVVDGRVTQTGWQGRTCAVSGPQDGLAGQAEAPKTSAGD
jgi:mycoredoxin